MPGARSALDCVQPCCRFLKAALLPSKCPRRRIATPLPRGSVPIALKIAQRLRRQQGWLGKAAAGLPQSKALRAGGNRPVHRQVRQKRLHLRRAHFLRVAHLAAHLFVKEYIALGPPHIAQLRLPGIMTEAHHADDALLQSWFSAWNIHT